MTFGVATVISSNMLLSSFVYALATRKKLLREIACIAFKKYRHVPDFSVILLKWLNCHRHNQKCAEFCFVKILSPKSFVANCRMTNRARRLLSPVLFLNQIVSICRLYIYCCRLFMVYDKNFFKYTQASCNLHCRHRIWAQSSTWWSFSFS